VDLFDVVRSCFRRWYVLFPLLLITAWFCYQSYSSAKPVYYASAVLGLAPPNSRVEHVDAGVALPRNGLLDAGGANFIANMTSLGLQQPQVVDRVVAGGGLPDYSAKMFPVPPTIPQPPLIYIEITGPDSRAVSTTLELVIPQAELTLKTLQQQARVPGDQMVGMFVVSPPITPVPGMPSRTKSTITMFVAGTGLAVLLTVLADVTLTHFKSRRKQRRQAQSEAAPAPDSAHLPNEVQHPINAAPVAEGVMEAK
jgi:hypothetical protein